MANTTYPQDLLDAFNKYKAYSDNLPYDPNHQMVGQKAHCTRLFNKFHNLCIRYGICPFSVSADSQPKQKFYNLDK